MSKEKKEEPEAIVFKLDGRSIAELDRSCRRQGIRILGTDDYKAMGLGFEITDKFLQLDGPQPMLMQIAMLASRLKLRIEITRLELIGQDAENATG